MRRRRWQERLHERKARRRERADQIRAEAKTLIVEKLQAAEQQRQQLEHESDSISKRLRRLQELRARLARATAQEPVCVS